MELKTGLTLEITREVTDKESAAALGSGGMRVFSTPMMIAFMEGVSHLCVEKCLEDGFQTVGTKVNIEHIAATPIGMKVTVKTVLEEVDGRKLTFKVEARDENRQIGFGTHERFIVNEERFLGKIY